MVETKPACVYSLRLIYPLGSSKVLTRNSGAGFESKPKCWMSKMRGERRCRLSLAASLTLWKMDEWRRQRRQRHIGQRGGDVVKRSNPREDSEEERASSHSSFDDNLSYLLQQHKSSVMVISMTIELVKVSQGFMFSYIHRSPLALKQNTVTGHIYQK